MRRRGPADFGGVSGGPLAGGAAEAAHAGTVVRSRARTLGIAVGAGGALGALARMSLDALVPQRAGGWPWPTFSANLLGCLLLGYLATRLLERLPPSTYRRPLVGTGLCGALTTFSTLQIEAITLARDGRPVMGVLYGAFSILGGLLLIQLGTAAARRPARIR